MAARFCRCTRDATSRGEGSIADATIKHRSRAASRHLASLVFRGSYN
ncbi:uncharacterized protein G6M90_00g055410 [Metarhizium brunneum]|uniref:Uncharacterized protein n=1 Tax=Metarhizium brunneum TaxID=500148 RepID=A0A7D5UWU2_9HYPO|nr:hypothetical protein G6M90_00g055410 [Metarhizium brunneum]